MLQLSPERFARVAHLFRLDLPNRSLLESVLAGRNPGWVFVDEDAAPSSAVVVARYSWTYRGGESDPELLASALAACTPAYPPHVVCASDERRSPLPERVPGGFLDRIEFSELAPTWSEPPPLPAGVELRPMTLGLLEQCLWRDEMLADCGTLARFLGIGFGVCGVLEGRVVSEAYASMPGDRAYEIGPIVHAEHRRKGLAYATCAAVIDECGRRGYETIWSCNRAHVASARLARKLGYRRERPYRFWVPDSGC